jgi:hypothetical protein
MDENEALAETPEEKAYFESAGAKPAPELPAEPAIGHEPALAGQDTSSVEQKPEPKQEPSRTVPHQALHEERLKRKEAEQRAQRLEERFNQLLDRMTQGQQAKPPSVDEDPVGVVRTHEEKLRQLEEQNRQQQLQAQQQNQFRAFMQRYTASANEFSLKQADFSQAHQYWLNNLAEELKEAGWTDPVEINDQLARMEAQIVSKAFSDDVNPAQRIYNIAKRRGYSSKPKPEEQKAEEKIATLQKGANAARSLSAASGNQSPPLTLEALAEMDDEDFDRNWDKVMKQANARR